MKQPVAVSNDSGPLMSLQNMEDGVDAEWTIIDRVIAQRGKGDDKEYLVKWCGLEYGAATWEAAEGLDEAEDEVCFTSPESGHHLSLIFLSQGCVFGCPPDAISLSVRQYALCLLAEHAVPVRFPAVVNRTSVKEAPPQHEIALQTSSSKRVALRTGSVLTASQRMLGKHRAEGDRTL